MHESQPHVSDTVCFLQFLDGQVEVAVTTTDCPGHAMKPITL